MPISPTHSMTLMYGLILLSICINVVAQLLLKFGIGRIGYFEFSAQNLLPIGQQIITSIPILLGVVLYVASLAVWLMVLSRVEVSVAFPMASLGYVFVAIAAYFLFGEALTPMRVTAILIIIFGVFLLTRTV